MLLEHIPSFFALFDRRRLGLFRDYLDFSVGDVQDQLGYVKGLVLSHLTQAAGQLDVKFQELQGTFDATLGGFILVKVEVAVGLFDEKHGESLFLLQTCHVSVSGLPFDVGIVKYQGLILEMCDVGSHLFII